MTTHFSDRTQALLGILAVSEVKALEAKLRSSPRDLETRVKLVRHYYGSKTTSNFERWLIRVSGGYLIRKATRNHRRHSLWIIENEPYSTEAGLPQLRMYKNSDPVGCRMAAALWENHLAKDDKDLHLIRNASKFLFTVDMKRAVGLLELGRRIEPQSLEWPAEIAYMKFRETKLERHKLASLALKARWHAQEARWQGSLDVAAAWSADQQKYELMISQKGYLLDDDGFAKDE